MMTLQQEEVLLQKKRNQELSRQMSSLKCRLLDAEHAIYNNALDWYKSKYTGNSIWTKTNSALHKHSYELPSNSGMDLKVVLSPQPCGPATAMSCSESSPQPNSTGGLNSKFDSLNLG
jgi:hypothetical protein